MLSVIDQFSCLKWYNNFFIAEFWEQDNIIQERSTGGGGGFSRAVK